MLGNGQEFKNKKKNWFLKIWLKYGNIIYKYILILMTY